MNCNYGCNQPARFFFKNGKGCCEPTMNKCPAKRQRDSDRKMGRVLPPETLRRARLSRIGQPSWNAGKTKLTDDRVAAQGAKTSDGYKTGRLVHHHTPMTEAHKQIMRERINARYDAGWMPKAGRCKKITHVSPYAGSVRLDGTWELTVAVWLDKQEIKWTRNTKRFPYVDMKGKQRTYTPDFYIEGQGCYVEVKGYETELDRCKWKAFPVLLFVWKKKEIELIAEGKPERFQELFAKQIAP